MRIPLRNAVVSLAIVTGRPTTREHFIISQPAAAEPWENTDFMLLLQTLAHTYTHTHK